MLRKDISCLGMIILELEKTIFDPDLALSRSRLLGCIKKSVLCNIV